MRIKYAKLITFFIIIFNILIIYYIWRFFISFNLLNYNFFNDNNPNSNNNANSNSAAINENSGNSINFGDTDKKFQLDQNNNKIIAAQTSSSSLQNIINSHHNSNNNNNNNINSNSVKNSNSKLANKHIKKSITIIFNNFYDFDNDIKNTIENFQNLLPTLQIFVIFYNLPYSSVDLLKLNSNNNSAPANINNNNNVLTNNLRIINLNYDVTKKFSDLNPIFQIKTKYMLFMPDSVRLTGKSVLNKIIKELNSMNSASNSDLSDNGRKLYAIPFASNTRSASNCYRINFDQKNWTLEYSVVLNGTEQCDMFLQKHAILVETNLLKQWPSPFSLPFPEMFYIQAKVDNFKVTMLNTTLQDGKRLFTSYHTKQKRSEIKREQFKKMYKKLKIKKVVTKTVKMNSNANKKSSNQHHHRRNNNNSNNNNSNNNNNLANSNNNNYNQAISDDGANSANNMDKPNKQNTNNSTNSNSENNFIFLEPPEVPFSILSNLSTVVYTNDIEYYGCEKTTTSCVGKIINAKPFYFYLNKNTPPCCLEKLQQVFNHVVNELEMVGIRYWLDNLALQNAIDLNTIGLNSYEIDISFNIDDLKRSNALKKSQTRPYIDESGYYWHRATDGNYFKIFFSKINQIGINLLPFEIIGDKVKPNGFYGWKAKEFSVEYLHPMSTVYFLGKNIMCPNNVREFLDIKIH